MEWIRTILERIRSEGLAHISYFVGSGDEAVVVDPRRDCQAYVEIAHREEMKIKTILETHRNEDYAIGSLELAKLTGARIFHGPGLKFGYGETLRNGQEFLFGQLKLTAIHTPGHTDESTSYVLTDISAGEQPTLVFTGDTLFVGDVGRIDLYGLEEAPRLAENLYDSIFKKLLPLGDGVMVYPAHGAGSVCGGAIGEREVSTLGLERLQNFALRKTRKDDFIRFKVSEHHERPPYFSKMEEYNLHGPRLLDRLPDPRPLLPREFKEQIELGAKVIDTREPPAFSASHIKDSYNIWLEGLPIFAGWVLTYDKPLLLILEDWIHLEKAVRYLIRLGYDRTVGYLRGGMEAWYREALPFEKIDLLSVEELKKRLERGDDLVILDVRGKDEWDDGHIEGAIHIYIGQLVGRLNEVPKDKPVAVVCTVGNRASLGASILRQDGRRDVLTVLGSMAAWENAGYPIVK